MSDSNTAERVFLDCGDSITFPESVSLLRFKETCDVDTDTEDDAGCMLIIDISDCYKKKQCIEGTLMQIKRFNTYFCIIV